MVWVFHAVICDLSGVVLLIIASQSFRPKVTAMARHAAPNAGQVRLTVDQSHGLTVPGRRVLRVAQARVGAALGSRAGVGWG